MLPWLAPILVFGLVIFVHELGHFLAAKWAGVYTPRFSVGFGPALWRRRRGETEYILAAIPFGGYVRMASQQDEATAVLEGGGESAALTPRRDFDPDAMIPFGPKPIPANRWFESKSSSVRIGILLAGVTMNALLAWAVNVGSFATYGRAYVPAVVDSVVPGRPAAAAGFQRGDSVLSVQGKPVRAWDDVVSSISARPGQPSDVEVYRSGQRVALTVTPLPDTATNLASGRVERVGRIGLAPRVRIERERVGIGEAIITGTGATVWMAGSILISLKAILSGEVGLKGLGGPIGIAELSVQAANSSFETLLSLIALISINLAILNLLPIPVLDGGNILLTLIEVVRRKPLSERARGYALRAGLAFLLLLVTVLTYNDLLRIVKRVVAGF